MAHPKLEGWLRLGAGIALNACLWPFLSGLMVWSSVEREIRHTFISAAIGAVAAVIVIPIFWRGQAWQAPIAFLLLWCPILAFLALVMLFITL
jgi:hypothetical protein